MLAHTTKNMDAYNAKEMDGWIDSFTALMVLVTLNGAKFLPHGGLLWQRNLEIVHPLIYYMLSLLFDILALLQFSDSSSLREMRRSGTSFEPPTVVLFELFGWSPVEVGGGEEWGSAGC